MDTITTNSNVVDPQSNELVESLNFDLTLFKSEAESQLQGTTPPDILTIAQKISESDFDFKSARVYNKAYEEYTSWLKGHNVSPDYVSSNCLLAYLWHLKTGLSAPTVVSRMSMIKAKIMKLYNRNIFQEFPVLMTEMKKMNEKHTKKQASPFSQEELVSFFKLEETGTPWQKYKLLQQKIIVLFAVFGGLRAGEIYEIQLKDVVCTPQVGLTITIHEHKTKKNNEPQFQFQIPADPDNPYMCPVKLWSRYMQYFPEKAPSHAFNNMNVSASKISSSDKQRMGKDKIKQVAKEVANRLNLNQGDRSFTGHSFRRTGASILAMKGVSLLQLKKWGSSKPGTVAQQVVDTSLKTTIQDPDHIVRESFQTNKRNEQQAELNEQPQKPVKLHRPSDPFAALLGGIQFTGTLHSTVVQIHIHTNATEEEKK